MSLYLVTDAEAAKGVKPRLVKANSMASAIRHVTGTRFTAAVVSNAEKAADLLTSGYTMETAGEDAAPVEEISGDDAPAPAEASPEKEEVKAKS